MKSNYFIRTLRKVRILLFVLGMVLLVPCFKGDVKAAEAGAGTSAAPMIMLERYDVTDEQIVPGEDFTLTLTLKNYSSNVTVKDVVVDITNPKGIMPVYGTVSQVYIDEIPAGETREVSVDYYADTVVDSTSVDFSLTIIDNGSATNYVLVRVPVGTDVPFYVLSDKFPTSVAVGENATSSLTFEVIGHANVRSVSHVVLVDGVAIGSSTIGSLTAGATRTQNTTVAFSEAGEYNVDIEIQYIDKADQPQSFIVGSKTITVYEKDDNDVIIPQEMEPMEENNENKSLILGLGGIVLIAGLLVIVMIRKKK